MDVFAKARKAIKQARRLRVRDGAVMVTVDSPREAELVLERLLANGPGGAGGEPDATSLQRIRAVALFQESGLHIKRAGGDWEKLGSVSGPTVLLVPSGIIGHVRLSDAIAWRKPTLLEQWSGCLGCLGVCGVLVAGLALFGLLSERGRLVLGAVIASAFWLLVIGAWFAVRRSSAGPKRG
jgi:hypothetical protein